MAGWEVWEFLVVIPPGVDPSAPVTISTDIPARYVREVRYRTARGHLGLMGWMLTSGGAPVQPQPGGTFIVSEGDTGSWSFENMPDGGMFEVTGYNLGGYPHTVYISFYVDPIMRKEGLGPPIDKRMLTAAPDLSKAGPPVGRTGRR